MTTVLLFACFVFCVPIAEQINFGQDDRFELTASQIYFRPGDDVTFVCRGTINTNTNNGPRSLVFPDSKGIAWERNGQSLFTTSKEGGQCRVQAASLFGRSAVTSRDLEAVTCTESNAEVTVTIKNVTITPAGDRWLCSQFPFKESNAVVLSNFAAVADVALTVEDHFPNDVTTEVLMTLRCQSSPCNPPPAISWRFSRGGKPLPLHVQSRTRSQTDGYGRVSTTSELAIPADLRYEGAVVTCAASNWENNDVTSKEATLTVKRAPRMLLSAHPSNDVIEGTDVTLTCAAHGHPSPSFKWRKVDGYLPGGLGEADTPILQLTPARLSDHGEYTCTAHNDVSPDAVNSIYLKVEKPIQTLKISDKDRHVESDHKASVEAASTSNNNKDENNSSSNSGTVAAVVIAVLVVIAAAVVGGVWLWRRRNGKKFMSSPSSSTTLFPRVEHGSMSAPRPGVYASRSSMRPMGHNSLTMDILPQYLELPPAPSPPRAGISNRAYGLSSNNGTIGRPLPAAPVSYDESRNTYDSGYDEIRDVTPEAGRMASPDGYEVPVLHEEEEEECIYDVARPDWSTASQRASSRRGTYMNEGSFSTQL